MRQWLAGWQKRLAGLFADDSSNDPKAHRRRVIQLGLQRLDSGATEPNLEAIIEAQDRLDALHRHLQEADEDFDIESVIGFDGLSRLHPIRDAGSGYIIVFIQGYLNAVFKHLIAMPKPLVSTVFRSHEDPSAHIQVLERGHGLGFELHFYPGEDPAVLMPFLGELTPVSLKPAQFAVQTRAPVIPVWCREESAEQYVLEFGEPMLGYQSPEALTTALLGHFGNRLRQSPAEIDWESDCWDPPAKRLLTSRRALPLHLPQGESMESVSPLSILAQLPTNTKEACLAIPALRALKRGRPDVHLSVFCKEDLTPLISQLPECDRWVTAPEEDSPPYDLGVVLSKEESAVTQMRSFPVIRLLGMENHPSASQFDDLLPVPRKLGPPEHRHRRYLRVAHRLGAKVEGDPTLKAPLPYKRRPPAKWTIGLAPESEGGPAFQWNPDRFIDLIAGAPFRDQVMWKVFLNDPDGRSTPEWDERLSLLEGVPVQLDAAMNALDDTLERMSQCQALVANDNLFLHLAAAIGVPVVAIYGPSEPAETAPSGAHAVVLRKHVECSPCFLKECALDHRCLNSISVDDVGDALESLLKRLQSGGEPL